MGLGIQMGVKNRKNIKLINSFDGRLYFKYNLAF